jgi:SWIM zinc finger
MIRVVVRNSKWDRPGVWANPGPREFVYEGQQVPAYKWSVPGTICMTTGDARWPVREIHPDSIISVDGVERTVEVKPAVEIFTVEGSKGSIYTVTIEGGRRTCTCPGFTFRRSCKHVTQELKHA